MKLITLDCMGDFCPIPILKLEGALKKLKKGQALMLVCDHSCVVENVGEFLANKPYHYEIVEAINGVWEITIEEDA
jgi:TusA-related sulfurtransferase